MSGGPPKRRAFDAVVVDFGGVLTTPLQDAMVAFAADVGMELEDLVRIALRAYAGHSDPLVVDFETGRISEEEFELSFAARIQTETGIHVDAEGLIARLFRGLAIEESMLRAIELARAAGYKTGLLSNSWGTKLYPRERIDELFDVVVISGEVGLRKPEAGIFNLTLERLGVAPERAVFVDDHPGHLAGAAEVGLHTVLHRSPDETIQELEGLLGVKLT